MSSSLNSSFSSELLPGVNDNAGWMLDVPCPVEFILGSTTVPFVGTTTLTVTFASATTYRYECQPHRGTMNGQFSTTGSPAVFTSVRMERISRERRATMRSSSVRRTT